MSVKVAVKPELHQVLADRVLSLVDEYKFDNSTRKWRKVDRHVVLENVEDAFDELDEEQKVSLAKFCRIGTSIPGWEIGCTHAFSKWFLLAHPDVITAP